MLIIWGGKRKNILSVDWSSLGAYCHAAWYHYITRYFAGLRNLKSPMKWFYWACWLWLGIRGGRDGSIGTLQRFLP